MGADEQLGKGTSGGACIPFPVSFGAESTPIGQRSGSAQAAVNASAITPVATTGSTVTTPYGYSQAQADAIPAAINAVITRQGSIITLLNELRATLVAHNLIAGA